MRRRSVLIMTVAGLAAIGVGMAPWTLADDHATRQIGKHLSALAGISLEVEGPVTLAVLPAPRIKFENIRLKAADGATVLTARQLRGQLQLTPLLSGRFVLADATLVDPTIRMPQTTGDASDLWTGALRLLSQVYERTTRGAPPISRLTIVGGSLTGETATHALPQGINATLSWPSPGATLALSGTAVLAGEPLEFVVSGLAPGSISTGGDTDLVVRFSSFPVRIDLRGALTDGGRRFDGKTRVSTPSLARVNSWLDLQLPLTGPATALTIDATCSTTSRGMALTSATVMVNDNALEGALTLRRSDTGGWALGGTLAADSLDVAAPEDLTGELGQLIPDAARWRTWDLDLRISAGRLGLPANVMARDVAASVLLRNGKLEAVLGGAEVLGGAVKGRMMATPIEAGGLEIRAQASADQIDAAQLSRLMTGAARAKGAVSGALSLEARGTSPAELRQRVEGRGQLQAGAGELTGVNLADMQRSGTQGAGEPVRLRGRTAFTALRASWTIGSGRITLDDGFLQGSAAAARFSGGISMADGVVALNGRIIPTSGARLDMMTPFRITGRWDAPIVETLPLEPNGTGVAP